MNAQLMIAMSTALVSVITIAGCGPTPDIPANEHGMCFRETYCGGNTLLGLPTRSQCKASGGKSWVGGNSNSCISFGFP
jgi:hypothetical protein